MNQAEANKAVAANFLRAIERGDLAAIDALLAPDFHWWVAGWGPRTRTELLAGLQRTMSGFEQRRITTTGFTAEGERVAVEAEGHFERPGLVYRNTYHYHYLFIVHDGCIASGREHFDTAAAAAAFGPPPGASS